MTVTGSCFGCLGTLFLKSGFCSHGITRYVLEEGDKVEAVFDEGDWRNWYPGVVDQVNGDGTFNVRRGSGQHSAVGY